MNIHEYQAKRLLKSFGVPVPPGNVAHSASEAGDIASALPEGRVVVKAQIHAGGRGAGRFVGHPACGGVSVVTSATEAESAACDMLDRVLVTRQTGPEGRLVRKLYVEACCAIARELYFSILIDRTRQRVAIVASQDGGMEIEEVAARTPDRVLSLDIHPAQGLGAYQARDLAVALGLKNRQIGKFAAFMCSAFDAFVQLDASLIEINPLVITTGGDLIALDAKMSFDDNALFRHPELEELREENEEDPREQEAARFGLSYIGLDGTIGCMVNGAGLAMATMDIIRDHGEAPANFLDVGGGASRERVTAAFRILLADPRVEGVLVNIFGGIMKCDIIAEAVVAACRDIALNKPLVVRLAGTSVDDGRKILEESGLNVIAADDLDDAARKIVAAVRGKRQG